MTALLAALGAALVGALGSYFVAARKLSGKIGTSDASQLWQESKDIRGDYRERLRESHSRVDELERRIGRLEGNNDELSRENTTLRLTVARLESEAAAAKERLDRLTAENESLRALVEARKDLV